MSALLPFDGRDSRQGGPPHQNSVIKYTEALTALAPLTGGTMAHLRPLVGVFRSFSRRFYSGDGPFVSPDLGFHVFSKRFYYEDEPFAPPGLGFPLIQ